MTNNVKVDVSVWTIIKIVLVFVAIWFLFYIRDILLLLFLTIIIVAALNPIVNWMSKFFSRTISVIILSFALVLVLTAIGFLIIPQLIGQLGQLSINLPLILNRITPIYANIHDFVPNYQEILFNISSQLGRLTSGLFATTLGFINGIVAFVTVIFLTFYILLEKEPVKTFIETIVAPEKKKNFYEIVKRISNKLGGWLRGQITLMTLVGILNGIALLIIGVPYALTLAIWGGLTEIIPYLGPWLGLIPAVIVALTISPIKALFVLIVYLVIQQIEAQFLVPKVMGKAVGLSPVIIIIAVLVGAKLFGILGILIAVPIAAVVWVLIQSWPEIRKLKDNS